MKNKKHQDFVREMMVVFTKKDDINNDQQPLDTINTEPEYIASDPFSDMANNMMQNFVSTINGGAPAPATHISVIGDLNPSENDTDETVEDSPEDQTVDTETSDDMPQNQIMFDLTDDGLVIKFDETELHLSKDAVTKLKTYLSDIENSSEDDSEDVSDKEE